MHRGVKYWATGWSDSELLTEALPPEPVFEEPLESVRARIATALGKVPVPKETGLWHRKNAHYLSADEERQRKQAESKHTYSWDRPIFDTPFERRRFRFLNAIFLALARIGGKADIRGYDAREIYIGFHQQLVGITLDRPKPIRLERYTAPKPEDGKDNRLVVKIKDRGENQARSDWHHDDGRIEGRATEIAIEIALAAEAQHREGSVRYHAWLVTRKTQLEKEEVQRRAEAERQERERLRRLEQARVDRLLAADEALERAASIGRYVDAIIAAKPEGVSDLELETWKAWALAQADRIDPTLGGAFLAAMRDGEDHGPAPIPDPARRLP